MFASLPEEGLEDDYLHITLTYTPSDDPGLLGPWNVYPFYLDVMGPVGEKEFPLPPGTHGMSWEGSPAIDGRILGIGGHLHDYADYIRLEDMTTGKVVWESYPELDENGSTIAVPTSKLWWRGGVKIPTAITGAAFIGAAFFLLGSLADLAAGRDPGIDMTAGSLGHGLSADYLYAR